MRRTQEKIPLKETLLGQPSCAGSQSIQTPGGIFIPSHLNDHFSRSLLTERRQITGSPEENDYDELILKHSVDSVYKKKHPPTGTHLNQDILGSNLKGCGCQISISTVDSIAFLEYKYTLYSINAQFPT